MSHGACCVCGNESRHPVFFHDANQTPKMVCMTCATEIHAKYVYDGYALQRAAEAGEKTP